MTFGSEVLGLCFAGHRSLILGGLVLNSRKPVVGKQLTHRFFPVGVREGQGGQRVNELSRSLGDARDANN